MKKACKVQCKECPFRHVCMPSYLGGYTASMVFNAIWRNVAFFCHPKINYQDPKWEEKASKNGRLCLGGLKFANMLMAPQRADAYPETDVEVLRERKLAEGRLDIDCMDPKEFQRWHEEGKAHERAQEMSERLIKWPRTVHSAPIYEQAT
jgi:hypothetical protein